MAFFKEVISTKVIADVEKSILFTINILRNISHAGYVLFLHKIDKIAENIGYKKKIPYLQEQYTYFIKVSKRPLFNESLKLKFVNELDDSLSILFL